MALLRMIKYKVYEQIIRFDSDGYKELLQFIGKDSVDNYFLLEASATTDRKNYLVTIIRFLYIQHLTVKNFDTKK